MRLSSIITIKSLLEEQIYIASKQIEIKGMKLKINDKVQDGNKLIADIKHLSKRKEALVKALTDIEFSDWH